MALSEKEAFEAMYAFLVRSMSVRRRMSSERCWAP